MIEFITYLGQSALCLVALYLIYKATMSYETLHRLNRVTLLAIVILAAVLPLCRIEIVREIAVMPTPIVNDMGAAIVAVVADSTDTINFRSIAEYVLVVLFLSGTALMVVRLVLSWLSVVRIVRSGEREELGEGMRLTVVEKLGSPFSWFSYIVVARSDMAEHRDMILEHEMAHVRLRHSWDVLFVDLALILWWFNPAMWLLRRELQSLHEYQADDAVLNRGIDAKTYQLLLIKRAVGSRLHSVANCLNHSNLKNRITMMCRKQSSKWQSAKLLFVLPMVAISLSAFATTVYVETKSDDKVIEKNDKNKNWKKAVIEIAGSKILLNDKQVTPEELDACIEEYILQTLIYNANDAESVKTYESIYYILKKNRAIDQIYPNGERPIPTIYLNGDKIYLNDKEVSYEELATYLESNKTLLNIKVANHESKENLAKVRELARQYQILTINYEQEQEDIKKMQVFVQQLKELESTKQDFDKMKAEYEAARNEILAHKDEYAQYEKQYAETMKQFAEFEQYLKEAESEIAKNKASLEEQINKAQTLQQQDELAYVKVEKMPTFQGGDLHKFRDWIQANMKYPAEAMAERLQGRVIFSFVVEKDASVSSFDILQTPSKVLADEVKRVFKTAPNDWVAGEQNGKKVRVKFTVPIVFALNPSPFENSEEKK